MSKIMMLVYCFLFLAIATALPKASNASSLVLDGQDRVVGFYLGNAPSGAGDVTEAAVSTRGYRFLFRRLQPSLQYRSNIRVGFSMPNCTGVVYIEAGDAPGFVFSTGSFNATFYVPQNQAVVFRDFQSFLDSSGDCVNDLLPATSVYQVLPNDPTETGVSNTLNPPLRVGSSGYFSNGFESLS